MKRTMTGRRGFTLLEITIALLILAIGLVGLLALFPVGFGAVGRANYMTVATFLAQGRLEDAKVAGYDSVSNVSKTQFSESYPNFEYEIIVTDNPTGADPPFELKQVDVIVYWPAAAVSGQQTVKLSTYIAKL